MKKIATIFLTMALAVGTLTACGNTKDETVGTNEPNTTETNTNEDTANAVDPINGWAHYDELIAEIKSTTDFVHREALMHEAEDMLMETGALVPLYYYNDIYMQKSNVSNIYANLYGYKFFMFAESPSNTLRLQLGSEPDKLDPALNSTNDGACLVVNSFSGLFTYDVDGNAVPDLVKDYTISEDGLVYTFNLLPDLKWSNGEELNANDFLYSWNRAVDPETSSDYSYMFDVIARNDDETLNVTASEDGQSLTVTLNTPCAYFFDLCAFPTYFPVKESEVTAATDWQTNPGAWAQEAGFVTNGAYTLTDWTHDQSMTYTKNPNYHRADEVKVEKLELMLSSDDTAIYAAYNADNLDFIDTVPTDEIKALLENPEFKIIENLGTYYFNFNVKSSLFDGKTPAQANAMRRALALLVDREFITENVTQTGQVPANTFIPEGMLSGAGDVFKQNDAEYTFPDEENVGYYSASYSEENVAEAIALLESAGFVFNDGVLSADTPLSFEYLTNDGTGHISVAEALQQDFDRIGINMTIKTSEWNVFLNERKDGNYDVARNGWGADFNDPINMLEMWTSDSGNNDCQFGK